MFKFKQSSLYSAPLLLNSADTLTATADIFAAPISVKFGETLGELGTGQEKP